MPVQQFRPYLSAPALLEIISALKSQPSPSRMPLIRYLEGFALKISHGTIAAAHTLNPSMEEKLGLSKPAEIQILTPAQCWEKWLDNPSACTPPEIESGMKWAYINDAMTPEQEALYEKGER